MTHDKQPLRARLREELHGYAVATLYLWVCLGALLLFKGALQSEAGVGSVHFGLALGKALILGKFVLIGEAARIGARLRSQTLLHLIVRKVLGFLLLLVVLSVAEEFVAGWIHGRSATQTLTELEQRSPLELFATCLLVALVLVPYIATHELSRVLGPGRLKSLLLGRPD